MQVQLSYLMVGHTHEDINQVILKFFNMLFHSMPPLEGIYQLLCTIDFTFYIKMFSRISMALTRTNAVTLDDLIQVIRGAYNPTPITCSVENIYNVKTWLRPFVPSLKHHSNPHAFRFKMKENGEVEMSYIPFAKSGRKQWLPEEGPIVLLKQVPPGKPSVIKPDMKKCPSVEVIKDSVEKLGVRMSSAQLDWWRKMAEDEERKRRQWESLTPDQYRKAEESFDLVEFKFQNEDPDPDEDGEYGERNRKLLRLIEKKENHLPVGLADDQCYAGNFSIYKKKITGQIFKNIFVHFMAA